jgi:isoquinoline 1-oxidoreductase beta subunit
VLQKPVLQVPVIEITAYLRISPRGITALIPHSELGQGVLTSLAMAIAEELECDWSTIRAETAPLIAPLAAAYTNPLFGVMVTGASSSIRSHFQSLRQAGAAAREMLLQAAAATWRVEPETCLAEKGEIRHPASSRRASYGALAPAAAYLPVPTAPALKPREHWRLLGTRPTRLDTPDKNIGRALFVADLRLPGQLFASVLHAPPGRRLERFDLLSPAETTTDPDSAAFLETGQVRFVSLPNGVAAVAPSWWLADQSLKRIVPVWSYPDPGLPQATAAYEPEAVDRALRRSMGQALEGSATSILRRGNPEAGQRQSVRILSAEYTVPFLAHAQLEPLAALARVNSDRCELWVPTQNQSVQVEAVAALLGLPTSAILLHTPFVGGSFGRRHEADIVLEAVRIARAVGAPVLAMWNRAEDFRQDTFRPPALIRLITGLDAANRIALWRHVVATPSLLARMSPGTLLREGEPKDSKDQMAAADPTAVQGILQPYAFPAIQAEHALVPLGIGSFPASAEMGSFPRIGLWRSMGHAFNAFALESMIDEVALATKRDPYLFRRSLLLGSPRSRRVLDAAADLALWNTPLPPEHGRGMALHEAYGSIIAVVAVVAETNNSFWKVEELTAVVDCGRIVHPGIVEGQIAGGLLFALSACRHEQILFQNGLPEQTNFDRYRLLRLSETPRLNIQLLESEDSPGGVGALAVPPLAPAVANALAALTRGRRWRSLPLPERLSILE